MKITKLDAATEQLVTAISLYFEDNRPISVHTLSKAAAEILQQLCKKSGIKAFLDCLPDLIVPGNVAEVRAILKKPQNFFKHADRDPDGVLDGFTDDINMLTILIACADFRHIAKADAPFEIIVFERWFCLVQPDLLNSPIELDATVAFGDAEEFSRAPRAMQKELARKVIARGPVPRDDQPGGNLAGHRAISVSRPSAADLALQGHLPWAGLFRMRPP